MRTKNKRKWIIIVVALLVVAAGIIYLYEPFSSGNRSPLSLSSPAYEDSGLFRIDPETIVASLHQGERDVFFPDSRTLENRYNSPLLYTEPILWSQADNLKIVNTLNEFVWNDTLDNWKLYRMIFNVGCQNNLNGLPGGIFTFYKTTFEKGKIIDIWRETEVAPEYSLVAWGGEAKFPHPVLGRENIDLNRLEVTAEDAIRIAEENGGRDARLKVQDQCNIHLLLTPESKGWVVNYQSADFEILIDPYTSDVIH